MSTSRFNSFEVVTIPTTIASRGWGEFSLVLDEVRNLTENKCVKLPRLTAAKSMTLRAAAKVRGLGLSIRNTPDASYVWMRGTTESVNEARTRKTIGVV